MLDIVILISIRLKITMDLLKYTIYLYFICWNVNLINSEPTYSGIKMCPGFKECAVGGHSTPHYNYKALKDAFGSGCTHVQGNVLIQGLEKIDGKDPDISFLDTIQEIAGCLLVGANTIPKISLKNLRIIRGQQAFKRQLNKSDPITYWSVYVSANHAVNKGVSGTTYPPALKHLDLRSLKSIQNYGVMFESNLYLCFPQYTVSWKDIFEKPNQEIIIEQDRKSITKFCTTVSKTSATVKEWPGKNNDGSCSPSCPSVKGKRYCWGRDADMCQTINKCEKRGCSYSNRCYTKENSKEEECCHPQCVAGCRGGTARDCLACREFLNDGECVRQCPPSKLYDKVNYKYISNPDRRLAWGPFCVLNCTDGYYEHEDSCVSSCGRNSYIAEGKKCLPCNNLCPKKCNIETLKKANNITASYTTRSLLKLLKNCTFVSGKIDIIDLSKKDPFHTGSDEEEVRLQDLYYLKNIRKFDGDISLHLTKFPEVKNLTFFENLEEIKGKFSIYDTRIDFLGLRRLKRVRSVIFFTNPKLCYLENFKQSLDKPPDKILIRGFNTKCKEERKVCDLTCKPEKGCRGPGPYYCGACALFKAGDICVKSCNNISGFFHGKETDKTKKCEKCHSECKSSCKGVGPADCLGGCKNFKDGPNCVKSCPLERKYANNNTGLCEDCHPACMSVNFGSATGAVCTGKEPYPGPNGCVFCEYLLMGNKENRKHVEKCITRCPNGTFKSLLVVSSVEPHILKYVREDITKICRPCHSECVTCDGASNYACHKCRNFKYKGMCVSICPPEDTYSDVQTKGRSATVVPYNTNGEQHCRPCHDLCRKGCTGPTQYDCKRCKNVKIYLDDAKTQFVCNKTCPAHLPYEENEARSGDTLCVVKSESMLAKESRQRTFIIASVVPATIIIIIIAIIVICCVLRTRDVARKERMRLKAKYTGALRDEEQLPLNETSAPSGTPNQSLLRIINSQELAKGNIIGSGAFGTVFRGKWYPPPDKDETQKVCIDVAIKLLSDVSDPALSAEFLEEARVMATVQNPYVMPLFGVCMTAQLQLVSRYMPHGSLLEYVRRKHATVKSKALVTWALQISKGMEYLESMKIIHRDLAARNVLVQEENHVRITDFGLAKYVDNPEESFQANGGKMPVKWLALECIRQRRFSHKSDVWAYGITLWELFTFGQRPYGNLNALQMCEYLERGERLQQPEICTLDVYMLMIKCWMPDEESRPSFHEIVEEMTKMSNDPSRFLVIQNDNARRHLSSTGSNSAGSIPRSHRPSQNSDEDKSGCGGSASYVPHTCPSSGDSLPRPGGSVGSPQCDDRHRHLAAATRRDRKAAAARYAIDPLSSSSPPASCSTIDDDYLEPHHTPAIPSAPSPYVNTSAGNVFNGSSDPLINHPLLPSTDNPEYFGPPSVDLNSPSYYNDEAFSPKSSEVSPPPPVKYSNWPLPSRGVDDSSV